MLFVLPNVIRQSMLQLRSRNNDELLFKHNVFKNETFSPSKQDGNG